MGYAFISYNSNNQSDAYAIKELFAKKGIRTWMAPGDIPAGSKYAQVINHAIKECSCLVLLLTDAAQKSPWVAKEVERAVNYGKTIIPIKLEEFVLNEEFEFYISTDQIVAVQKVDGDAEGMKKILRSVVAYTGEEEIADDKKSSDEPSFEKKTINVPKKSAEEKKKAAVNTKKMPLLFGFFYIPEAALYLLGVILFIYNIIVDPEFAFPLLMVFFGLGFIPSTIIRLVRKKPILPTPFDFPRIAILFTVLYSVVISYIWGDDMYFYKLFEDWGEYDMDALRQASTTNFLIFFVVGIAMCVILRILGKGMNGSVVSWGCGACASAALLFAYCFVGEHFIKKVHMNDLYDSQTESYFLVLLVIAAIISIGLFVFAKKRNNEN